MNDMARWVQNSINTKFEEALRHFEPQKLTERLKKIEIKMLQTSKFKRDSENSTERVDTNSNFRQARNSEDVVLASPSMAALNLLSSRENLSKRKLSSVKKTGMRRAFKRVNNEDLDLLDLTLNDSELPKLPSVGH